jgi:LacI family transcriptional regulator
VASDAFDQVTSDNAGGGRAVAAYFCDHGRRRIGLLSAHDYPASTIQDRERGFMQELLRRGVRLEARDVARVHSFSYQAGFDAATEMMATGDFDAIFCVNDIVGIGALDALRRGGVAVPGRTWVIGYDDIPMCAWECVGLSTVRQPMADMVERAVALLLRRLAGDSAPHERLELPNGIVHRRSSSDRS